MLKESGTFYRAAGLAALTGLRSMAGPALLSRAIRRGDVEGLQDTPFQTLGAPRVSAALQLLMIGEMIADKTPFVPNRTAIPSLLGRAFSGALVGAALFTAEGRNATSGAALGILPALVAAYAGEKLRTQGPETLGVPSLLLALFEDAVVLSGGTRLLSSKVR